MRGHVLGLVVTGGNGPLHGLGITNDAALTPFAGKYRFIDFALATATNSGVGPVYVVGSRPSAALHAHLGRAARAGAELRRPFPLPLPGSGRDGGRAARLVRAGSSSSPGSRRAWRPPSATTSAGSRARSTGSSATPASAAGRSTRRWPSRSWASSGRARPPR